jgi:hypothetical protein
MKLPAEMGCAQKRWLLRRNPHISMQVRHAGGLSPARRGIQCICRRVGTSPGSIVYALTVDNMLSPMSEQKSLLGEAVKEPIEPMTNSRVVKKLKPQQDRGLSVTLLATSMGRSLWWGPMGDLWSGHVSAESAQGISP